MKVMTKLDPRLRGGDSILVDTLFHKFKQLLITHNLTNRSFYCAISSGVDSVVLLDVASQLKKKNIISSLTALHIHHGLQTDADLWQNHVEQLAKHYNIPFKTKNVTVQCDTRESLEAKAREARYDALAEMLPKDGVLVMAQHQDDQAETFLLQAMRGAGPKGLASMPTIRPFNKGFLLRPWLSVSKKEIIKYAKENNLKWMEDTSNLDQKINRNLLRHSVLPKLNEARENVTKALSRSAKHCASAQQVVTELAAPIAEKEALPLSVLRTFKLETQQALFRCWCDFHQLDLPNTFKLTQILSDFLTAAIDRQPACRLNKVTIRRYADHLWVDRQDIIGAEQQWDWMLDKPLALPMFGQQLLAVAGKGLDIKKVQLPLQVRFRKGGEKIRLAGDQHTRILKKLLQVSNIPPWQRATVPLIYDRNTLIAVVGVGVADGYFAQKGIHIRLANLNGQLET